MGAIVGVLYRKGIATAGRILLGAGVMALACTIIWTAPALSLATHPLIDFWRVLLFGLPAAAIMYGLSAWELRGSPNPPPLLVALGDYSYATCLLHVLVLSAIGRIIAVIAGPGTAATCVLLLVGFVAANVAGALTYRFFERPNLTLLYDIGRRHLAF